MQTTYPPLSANVICEVSLVESIQFWREIWICQYNCNPFLFRYPMSFLDEKVILWNFFRETISSGRTGMFDMRNNAAIVTIVHSKSGCCIFLVVHIIVQISNNKTFFALFCPFYFQISILRLILSFLYYIFGIWYSSSK